MGLSPDSHIPDSDEIADEVVQGTNDFRETLADVAETQRMKAGGGVEDELGNVIDASPSFNAVLRAVREGSAEGVPPREQLDAVISPKEDVRTSVAGREEGENERYYEPLPDSVVGKSRAGEEHDFDAVLKEATTPPPSGKPGGVTDLLNGFRDGKSDVEESKQQAQRE